jgi:hypothetical protein
VGAPPAEVTGHLGGEARRYPSPMETSFWACAVITLASALTSLGFSVAAVRAADGPGQMRCATMRLVDRQPT